VPPKLVTFTLLSNNPTGISSKPEQPIKVPQWSYQNQ
jgi:hypothetical protein